MVKKVDKRNIPNGVMCYDAKFRSECLKKYKLLVFRFLSAPTNTGTSAIHIAEENLIRVGIYAREELTGIYADTCREYERRVKDESYNLVYSA